MDVKKETHKKKKLPGDLCELPRGPAGRKRPRSEDSLDELSDDDLCRLRKSRTQPVPAHAVSATFAAVSSNAQMVPTIIRKDKSTQTKDDEQVGEWSADEAEITTRYSFTVNAAGQKAWSRETTTSRKYISNKNKIRRKIFTTATIDSVVAKEVSKRIKREMEWKSLTDEERKVYNGDFVEYLISKTQG